MYLFVEGVLAYIPFMRVTLGILPSWKCGGNTQCIHDVVMHNNYRFDVPWPSAIADCDSEIDYARILSCYNISRYIVTESQINSSLITLLSLTRTCAIACVRQ